MFDQIKNIDRLLNASGMRELDPKDFVKVKVSGQHAIVAFVRQSWVSNGQSGPSIIRRKLPFLLAELLQRLAIVILPLAGILYPLGYVPPGLCRRHMENRLYRLYGEPGFIEGALQRSASSEERAQRRVR